MTRIGRLPGGGRLAAAVAAVSAVFCALGALTPATQASAFAFPTWTRQAPGSSPPARFGEAMAHDAATGTTVLFGGIARHGRGHLTVHLPEGWHRRAEWTSLFHAGCGPPARAA
jgi:hypothetical protein